MWSAVKPFKEAGGQVPYGRLDRLKVSSPKQTISIELVCQKKSTREGSNGSLTEVWTQPQMSFNLRNTLRTCAEHLMVWRVLIWQDAKRASCVVLMCQTCCDVLTIWRVYYRSGGVGVKVGGGRWAGVKAHYVSVHSLQRAALPPFSPQTDTLCNLSGNKASN